MKIQDQVCTLEQSKRLKELGVDHWITPGTVLHFQAVSHSGVVYADAAMKNIWRVTGQAYDINDLTIHALWTVAELGVMLPYYYPSWRFSPRTGATDKWITTIICQPKPSGVDDLHTAHEFDRYADTQAQSMAMLLISLLEEKVITAEEINHRLSE